MYIFKSVQNLAYFFTLNISTVKGQAQGPLNTPRLSMAVADDFAANLVHFRTRKKVPQALRTLFLFVVLIRFSKNSLRL